MLTPNYDADVTLSQSVGNPTPIVGSSTYVYLQLSNSGPAATEGVVVAHALGAGLTIDSVSASQGSSDQATGVWSVGQLIAGASAYLQVFVTVVETGAYTTSAAFTASSRPDPNTADNSAAQKTITPEVGPIISALRVTSITSSRPKPINWQRLPMVCFVWSTP